MDCGFGFFFECGLCVATVCRASKIICVKVHADVLIVEMSVLVGVYIRFGFVLI